MKLSRSQKEKVNELLKAVQNSKDKIQLRNEAEHIIPNNQEAIPILQGFIEIIKKTLGNDKIDNEECRHSLNDTIDVLRAILKDGKISSDERIKILDTITELHRFQKDMRKAERLKNGIIIAAFGTLVTIIIIVFTGGKGRQQA